MRLFSLKRRPKVFFIGFNKCGTKTFHHFFAANGYRSAHYACKAHAFAAPLPMARVMADNIAASRPVLTGLTHYDAFSDMTFADMHRVIEANLFFRQFHAECPDAYFVFNDRPVEKWLLSRAKHGNAHNGSFIARHASALMLSQEATIDHWRQQYVRHKQDVLAYFSGHERFMVFDLEADGPEQMAAFLKPHYRFENSKWTHRGATKNGQ